MNIKGIIERAVGRKVDITLTDNRTNIISFRESRGRIVLRIQRVFTEAPLDVILEIADLVRDPSRKTPLIDDFFRRKKWKIKKRPHISDRIEPLGRVYNLEKIFDKLNREYFSDEVRANITWGRRSPARSVRKRTLGSYNAETGTIRINPMLDSVRVPLFFIEYVVYHEMLHAKLGIRRNSNGRLRIHTREFKEMEGSFRYYKSAVEWEKRIA
ncbi:sprT-like family protein [bacterium BMS3Bbin06]|nr:sprT-like family protein [bacterium BMS3Abin08]GBE33692.1 sprT-like family protein [bacterium BMS3Bbin06]HDO36587.1 DUF45 domain-containing protein [Nitrospirota bacterium]HDY71025.1 DUF45 domain-containing protein [Nitrospirota bacterium]